MSSGRMREMAGLLIQLDLIHKHLTVSATLKTTFGAKCLALVVNIDFSPNRGMFYLSANHVYTLSTLSANNHDVYCVYSVF